MEIESSLPIHKCPPPVPILSQNISPGLRLTLWLFGNRVRFLRWGFVSTSPNLQAGGQPLVGCPRLPIQYIRSYPPYRRPFLHPQPEDAPCRGDRDPLVCHTKTKTWSYAPLFTSTLDLKLRKKLVKCYIWSIALYGAETWTLRAADQKHLESFEMWCWRRMEKISWTDHVRNEEVLLRVNEQRNILHEISKRKANWIGHILRRNCRLLKEK